MRKLVLVLVMLIAGEVKTEAQSMLKVSLRDNAQLSVAVDNRYFNKKGTSISVGDLPYGTHTLKVYTIVYNRRGKGREEMVYEGAVKTYNNTVTTLVYDQNTGEKNVQEIDMDTYFIHHPMSNKGKFSGSSSGSYNPANNTANNNYSNSSTVANESNENAASPIPPEKLGTLTDAKKAELKKKVDAKATDTQKMTVLKDELKNEQINTSQVADMMDWFAFDASKVDFAKWAYKITADRDYFSDLENKFAYKSSQEEFAKFLKEQ